MQLDDTFPTEFALIVKSCQTPRTQVGSDVLLLQQLLMLLMLLLLLMLLMLLLLMMMIILRPSFN
jgi:hypothetical protein